MSFALVFLPEAIGELESRKVGHQRMWVSLKSSRNYYGHVIATVDGTETTADSLHWHRARSIAYGPDPDLLGTGPMTSRV